MNITLTNLIESEIIMERELIDGNIVYAANMDKSLLNALAKNGQKPQAVVVACSDSRVPVEIVFNISLPGKLFVIRVAGNIISGPVIEGSIEFAIRQLKTPFIILLGHTECGVVKACIDGEIADKNVARLFSLLNISSNEINQAVVENLDHQFRNLLNVECVQDGVNNGELVAYSMLYDLHTGKIAVRNRVGNNQVSQL
jgi:carbonic anhydrase